GAHYYVARGLDDLGRFIIGESGRAVGQAGAATLDEIDRRSKEITQKSLGVAIGFQNFVIPMMDGLQKWLGDAGAGLVAAFVDPLSGMATGYQAALDQLGTVDTSSLDGVTNTLDGATSAVDDLAGSVDALGGQDPLWRQFRDNAADTGRTLQQFMG